MAVLVCTQQPKITGAIDEVACDVREVVLSAVVVVVVMVVVIVMVVVVSRTRACVTQRAPCHWRLRPHRRPSSAGMRHRYLDSNQPVKVGVMSSGRGILAFKPVSPLILGLVPNPPLVALGEQK